MSRMIIPVTSRNPWMTMWTMRRSLHKSKFTGRTANILQNRYYAQACENGKRNKAMDQSQSSDAKENLQLDPNQVENGSNNCYQISPYKGRIQVFTTWVEAALRSMRGPKYPGPNKGSDPEHH